MLFNLHEIKLGDLQIVDLGKGILEMNWSRSAQLSQIIQYGYNRPAIFIHILKSIYSLSSAIKSTRQLRQRAAMGWQVETEFLNSILTHHTFNELISIIKGIQPSLARKILLLAYLNPTLIDRKLAEWLYGNWCQKNEMQIGSLDLDTWADASIIEWNTSAKIAFSLDPYIQTAVLYKYSRSDSGLGRSLWELTRMTLE